MAQNTAGQTLTYNVPQGSAAFAVGMDVFDATSITTTDYTEIVVGFKPKYVRWENLTDRVMVEFFEGMTAGNCLKTAAAGTRTLETTNGGITLTNTGFRVLQNATLAAILASKTCMWTAKA